MTERARDGLPPPRKRLGAGHVRIGAARATENVSKRVDKLEMNEEKTRDDD